MAAINRVELGFLEKAKFSEELTSRFFPSKVGGKPAWLDPSHLVSPEETACSVCGVPRTFLLQVYAPLPDTPSAFHRTFFLFMCLTSSCHQYNDARGFQVFRCQLPRRNPFYNEDSGVPEHSGDDSASESDLACQVNGAVTHAHDGVGVDEDEETNYSIEGDSSRSETTQNSVCSTGGEEVTGETVGSSETTIHESMSGLSVGDQHVSCEPTALCVVCGCAGPKKCSRCRMVYYCSKHHQTHDWKNGHKLFCSDLASGKSKLSDLTYDPSYGVCLLEFEVVTEEEPMVKENHIGDREEEERMRDYHKFVKSGKYHDHSKGGKRVQVVMEKAESEAKSDKVFKAFRRRVAMEPEQVIRYQRGGHPLLVSQDSTPKPTDILPCACGADRQFEFQVMPQLLYYLKLDMLSEASVDWGTVLIYSCTASCTTRDAATCRYTTDLVWKQDFSTLVS